MPKKCSRIVIENSYWISFDTLKTDRILDAVEYKTKVFKILLLPSMPKKKISSQISSFHALQTYSSFFSKLKIPLLFSHQIFLNSPSATNHGCLCRWHSRFNAVKWPVIIESRNKGKNKKLFHLQSTVCFWSCKIKYTSIWILNIMQEYLYNTRVFECKIKYKSIGIQNITQEYLYSKYNTRAFECKI